LIYISLLAGLLAVLQMLFFGVIKKKELLSKDQSIKIDYIHPVRGDILANDGQILATTALKYDIYFDPNTPYLKKHPEVFDKNIDSLCKSLSDMFKDRTPQQYKQFILKEKNKGSSYIPIQKNVSLEQVNKLKKFPLFNLKPAVGGRIIEEHRTRIHPFKKLARRTIGEHVYHNAGISYGLERAYMSGLSGSDGIATYRVVNKRRVEDKVIQEPVDGKNLITTLDINLQEFVENTLEDQLKYIDADYGTAVVMDVKTGEIRAIANLERGKNDTTSYYETQNFAVKMLYEVGSVMKPISMLALFEEHPEVNINKPLNVNTTTMYLIPGKPLRDPFKKPLGRTTLYEVIVKSSNIGTIKLIQEYFKNKQYEFINRLVDIGVSYKSGIDLLGEPAVQLKDPEQKIWWNIVSLSYLSIGYEYQMTPIQVLALYNAIANDGKYVPPHLGKYFEKDGEYFEIPHKSPRQIASVQSVRKVQKLLEGVVLEGTGSHTVKSKLIPIAGKTGTAKISDKKTKRYINEYNTTFVGYFPADNPKYSMIVTIHKPRRPGHRTGATSAGPVVKKVAEYLYRTDTSLHKSSGYVVNTFPEVNDPPRVKYGLTPKVKASLNSLGFIVHDLSKGSMFCKASYAGKDFELYPVRIHKGQVPKLINMSAEDAAFMLENLGMKVIFNARGAVFQQYPQPGQKINPGSYVKLNLR